MIFKPQLPHFFRLSTRSYDGGKVDAGAPLTLPQNRA